MGSSFRIFSRQFVSSTKPGSSRPLLVLVTPEKAAKKPNLEFETALQQVASQIDVLLIRNPQASTSERASVGLQARSALAGLKAHCPILVMGDGDFSAAEACSADGVHVPGRLWSSWGRSEVKEMTARARRLQRGSSITTAGLLSLSVHSVEEAIKATAIDPDIIILGTIFPTASHPELGDKTAGAGLCSKVSEMLGRCPTQRPWLIGIGGINATNCEEVTSAGADGCAVIRSIWDAPHRGSACAKIHEGMQSGLMARNTPVKLKCDL